MAAPAFDSGFCQRFVSFHQYTFSQNISLPFHFDGTVGAHRCTHCTANAQAHIRNLRRMISFCVENIMCQNDDFFGAHSCAKATAFADVFRNCYLCHCNPPYFLTDQNRKTVDWQNFFIFPTGAGHKYPPDKLTFLSANRQDPFVPWSRRGEHLPRQRHLRRRLLHL